LNCASEYGLSSETWGRECVFSTPRSHSFCATVREVIDEPRSACSVNWPGSIPCRRQVSAMNSSASAADSFVATIQPTT
jgi:hypothetical protein